MNDTEPVGPAPAAFGMSGAADPLSMVPDFSKYLNGISVESVLSVVILIVFVWWAIFTLVVIYHWARYARDSWMAVPAVALHLFVSGWIFVFATGGLH